MQQNIFPLLISKVSSFSVDYQTNPTLFELEQKGNLVDTFEMLIYSSALEDVKVEVVMKDETIWATQKGTTKQIYKNKNYQTVRLVVRIKILCFNRLTPNTLPLPNKKFSFGQ